MHVTNFAIGFLLDIANIIRYPAEIPQLAVVTDWLYFIGLSAFFSRFTI